MKYVFVVIFALGLAALGCVPAAKNGHPSGAAAGEPAVGAAASAEPSADAQAYERRAAASGRTFLDTLNRGKEIGVAEGDLPPIIEMSASTAPVAVASASPSAAPAPAEPRFRIQILASGQVDMVRREQQKAEATMEHPVIMVAEQSLFKLYVGEFGTRAEAETVLPKIKKDYPDAWIVNK